MFSNWQLRRALRKMRKQGVSAYKAGVSMRDSLQKIDWDAWKKANPGWEQDQCVPGVLTSNHDITPEEAEAVRKAWKARFPNHPAPDSRATDSREVTEKHRAG